MRAIGRRTELHRRGRAPPLPRPSERHDSEPAETDEHQRPGGGFGNDRKHLPREGSRADESHSGDVLIARK